MSCERQRAVVGVLREEEGAVELHRKGGGGERWMSCEKQKAVERLIF